MGEIWQMTAHSSRLRPPWVANRASRATSGRILAVAQDEVREHREHRFARGALDTPDGETTQPDTGIVGVAGQAPALAAAALVEELKTEREDKRQHELDKRFGITQEGKVGRLIVEVDGNRTVLAGRCRSLAHGSPSVEMAGGTKKPS